MCRNCGKMHVFLNLETLPDWHVMMYVHIHVTMFRRVRLLQAEQDESKSVRYPVSHPDSRVRAIRRGMDDEAGEMATLGHEFDVYMYSHVRVLSGYQRWRVCFCIQLTAHIHIANWPITQLNYITKKRV